MSDSLTLAIRNGRSTQREAAEADDSWIRQPWTSGLTQVQVPQVVREAAPLRADSALVGTGQREKQFRDCLTALQSLERLPENWDRYGGVAACPQALVFAHKLLHKLASIPTDVPAPVVRPISGGVYLEWRVGNVILYFEVDDESVLQYSRTALGEQTFDDPNYDWEHAYKVVNRFFDDAA